MGCDIHAFVEFLRWDSYWSLTDGTLNIPRDYDLFTVLALGPGGLTDELPYPPRGLPANISSAARAYFYSPIAEVKELIQAVFAGDEDFDPEGYLEGCWEAARQEFLNHGLLPAVDFHSHSWLNLEELKEVLAHGHISKDKLSPEFCAVLAAMAELAGTDAIDEVRLVFCFDGMG